MLKADFVLLAGLGLANLKVEGSWNKEKFLNSRHFRMAKTVTFWHGDSILIVSALKLFLFFFFLLSFAIQNKVEVRGMAYQAPPPQCCWPWLVLMNISWISYFFKFLYLLLAFSKWSTSTICKSRCSNPSIRL